MAAGAGAPCAAAASGQMQRPLAPRPRVALPTLTSEGWVGTDGEKKKKKKKKEGWQDSNWISSKKFHIKNKQITELKTMKNFLNTAIEKWGK
jgi:hypothetical protein